MLHLNYKTKSTIPELNHSSEFFLAIEYSLHIRASFLDATNDRRNIFEVPLDVLGNAATPNP